jgi:hypothetical protein
MQRLLPHVEQLSKHGLCGDTPRYKDLAATLGRAQDLLDYPILPHGWFNDDPTTLVRSILSLHESERKLDSIAATVREFTVDSGIIPPAARDAVTSYRTQPYLCCLQISPTASLRQFK